MQNKRWETGFMPAMGELSRKFAAYGLPLALTALATACGGGSGGVDSSPSASVARSPNAKGKTTDTTVSTAQAPAPVPGPPLGVNLEALTDWARLPPFVDMMKTSRHWGSVDTPWDKSAAVDALGWPTGDAGIVVRVDAMDPADTDTSYQYVPAGTYRLKFTGPATVTPIASNISIANYAYDPATNRSTADVVVGATATTQLMLVFRGTNGGVKEVSLRRPGYADTDTFTNEFKAAVAPFGTLRFMDYLSTNNSPNAQWALRTTPASASQAGPNGGSYEYAIQMANELGKDIWLNIPVNADDAYIRWLANLLNTTLAPGRVVYLEYSNEVWNTIFSQSTDNTLAAVAEVVAGDTSLTNGVACTQAQFDANNVNTCNRWWAGWRRVGKRTVAISKIFKEVMGAQAFNTRFRPVYATQWGYRAIGEQTLKYIAKYHGAPKDLIYGIAGAPYFAMIPYDAVQSTTLTVDQILTNLQSTVDTQNVPGYKPNLTYTGGDYTNATQKSLADYYGIKSLAYEGGLDLGQSDASATAKMQANKDPRMGDIVTSDLTQWYGCGNDLFLYYNLTSGWDRSGYWGLTNNARNLALPRYTAARQVATKARTEFTTCR
jgi:hypothetical protein